MGVCGWLQAAWFGLSLRRKLCKAWDGRESAQDLQVGGLPLSFDLQRPALAAAAAAVCVILQPHGSCQSGLNRDPLALSRVSA